jgi:predicted Rossmann fold flavoprotein
MKTGRIVIIGGGAAGFFAAIAGAEQKSGAEIVLLEKSPQCLAKVKISGGGRCNVTHACFNEREFSTRYPRGERALIAPFKQFQAADTVAWFEARGVELKAEADGRMFPVTDSSQTIIDCLLNSARAAGVKVQLNCAVERITQTSGGGFELMLSRGQTMNCDRVLLATGGCRTAALGQLAVSLGHTLEPPVPSLFTFHLDVPWVRELSGVSVEPVELSVPAAKLRERGPLLLTHWGLSGPVVLRLSAWGARSLQACDYQFALLVNWLPAWNEETLGAEFQRRRQAHPARQIVNSPVAPLSARLWEQLVAASGVAPETRWAALSGPGRRQLLQPLLRTEFRVTGKSLNKDEFVTCGGVRLNEVDFKTMGSKRCPGLFFAGEVLDVDGLTGGFNFQAAWTTGWLAGRAMVSAG